MWSFNLEDLLKVNVSYPMSITSVVFCVGGHFSDFTLSETKIKALLKPEPSKAYFSILENMCFPFLAEH